MIEVCAVGGYDEIGKNMTAVKAGDEAVIIDMGLHLDSYIKYTEGEGEDMVEISPDELAKVGAIPNDRVIKDWMGKVKAIIPTHAHLDHVGALTFLSNRYDAPILCTPFTSEVIKTISRDEKIKLRNSIKVLNVNSVYWVSKNIRIEFINMTHSTPQTVMVAVHTPEGTLLYANDFKFDNHPTLGKKPNYKRLEELGNKGVKVLICDCTRARQPIKTPSELVAKEMLRDVMLGVDSRGKAVIVTTFASHLARLKSIIEFGKKMNRKVVFLGRSLAKYTQAGEKIDIISFSKDAEIVKFGKQIKNRLSKMGKQGIEKYLLVVTGHQGEPKSTLSKIVNGEIPFRFKSEDHVIFSCTVIPSKVNIENRAELERKLREKGVRIFRDIHASGHASREDLRDLINLVKPKNIIPAHGEKEMKEALVELAIEKGYRRGKTVHIVHDGDKISF
ncbi:RNase J family beta-CASP ribonuclease [Candidatus Woesearchaeota archaeon]|nr:RNase J family beta-CASP ribonuclease [Candidatus Woesearchaeota archaeon]